MKYLIKTIFLFSICLAVCVNCSRQTDKKQVKTTLELAIWGNIKEVNIIKESIQIFNKNYPDIEVVISHSPQGQGYIDRLLTRAASGTIPDIIFCEVNFINKFIEKDMLMDISRYIKEDKDITENNYFSKIINRFKQGKKVYGLPRDVAPFACIYYNKSLFDQEGVSYPQDNWNLNDFLSTAKKLTKKNNNGQTEQFGFYTWIWQNFIYAFGGRLVDNTAQPKRCMLDQEKAIKGIMFYRDLIYKYKVMPAPSSIEMGFKEMFMTGKVAMYGSGIWEVPSFRDIKSFNWDIVMFPKGYNGERGFATGGSGYAMSKTTKNPDLAYQLLKVLSGEYGQIKLAQTGLAQPALKKLAFGKYWARDTENPPLNKSMLNQAVDHIIFNPFIPEWPEYEQKYINPVIDLVIRNKKDVKEGLTEAADKINKLLK